MSQYTIDSNSFTLKDLHRISSENQKIGLADEARKRVTEFRNYLENRLQAGGDPIYGINTGFGSLCNVVIPNDELQKLQINLVRSHACGMGDTVPKDLVRLMLLLKAKSLSYGNSGVRPEVIDAICLFYNSGLAPVVYEQGSLGASGDLAPLAHLVLPILGEGEVDVNGTRVDGAEVMKTLGVSPIQLEAKEGLALLNGTQFMLAYATHCLIEGWKLFAAANQIAGASLEGFNGRIDAFKEQLHTIRPHKGQLLVAKIIHDALRDSGIMKRSGKAVQDPYSFRCIPQVHGATYTTLAHVTKVVETEMNSVTDNPNIFPGDDLVLSGGNFHGQHLALVLDYLAIALAELANISERRTYLLVSGQRDLPPYLSSQPGTQSGFMIPQYTAASIVSQNKQLCHPASVDSIVSSNGQEDHVSMGANAATKCLKVVNNLRRVLGIELMTASQALHFRGIEDASAQSQELCQAFRKEVDVVTDDRFLHKDLKQSEDFVGRHFPFPDLSF